MRAERPCADALTGDAAVSTAPGSTRRLGCVSERAREKLLGELELVLRSDGPSLRDQLLAARKELVAREPAIEPPAAPQPPVITLAPDDDPPVGVHSLGALDVSTRVTLADNGWEDDLFPIDSPVRIPTKPGTWHAWLIVQEPSMPASLKAKLAAGADEEEAEELIHAFAYLFRRTWLVLTADSGPPPAPTLNAGRAPTYAQLLAASKAANEATWDPFEVLPVGIASGPDRIPLERAGAVGQLSGQLVVIAGAALSAETARALRATPMAGVRAWRWGLAWWRRPVETPVLVGGPKDARTWIAVPDPGY